MRQHLKWSSLEDVSSLVDTVSQQAVLLTLKLLCSSIQRFGNSSSIRDVTLKGRRLSELFECGFIGQKYRRFTDSTFCRA